MNNKNIKFDEDQLIGIFYLVDEFCLQAQSYVSRLGSKSRSSSHSPTRIPELSASEMMTILIYYNYSGYKNFQYYYQRLVSTDLLPYFPKLCSYNRFLELIERVSLPMYVRSRCGTCDRWDPVDSRTADPEPRAERVRNASSPPRAQACGPAVRRRRCSRGCG